MSKVLDTCKLVADVADIKIDDKSCRNVADKIYTEIIEGRLSRKIYSSDPMHPRDKNDKTINWIFVVDTLNFCFWPVGENCWEIKWNNDIYSGYYGLCAAINRAIEEGTDMTDPNVYSALTLEKLRHILRGENNVELLLLEERLQCLQESGNVLIDKYNGSFVNCIRECDCSAQKLLTLIVSNFSRFKDEAKYNNHDVALYKRAQILVADIWLCFEGEGLGRFTDIDSITMFADYRVPQVLCFFGVLQYPDALLMKLVENKMLENGSKEEVEIRATSVVAVSKINEAVNKLLNLNGQSNQYECNNILIDIFLWTYRRKRAKYLECIPFHKTISIYY